MPVEKQSGVSFPTPGSYLVFKIMNCSLWTCSKSLMPYSIQFINNYKFFCSPCQGLLFFYSSCLLQLKLNLIAYYTWKLGCLPRVKLLISLGYLNYKLNEFTSFFRFVPMQLNIVQECYKQTNKNTI